MTRRWKALPGNVRGSIWLMGASLLFAIMAAGVKFVGQRIPVLEILFFRQLFVIMILTPKIASNFPGIFITPRWRMHLARVCCSFVAMSTGFTAIVHMQLAEATAISFSRGFFTTILAVLVLHEIVGPRRWGATAVGFIGVLIIVRPSPENLNEYAWLGLISAVFVAVIMVLTRILSQKDPPTTIMAYQSLLLTGVLAPPAYYYWILPTFEELALMAGIGGVMAVAQYANIKAYQNGETTAIQPMEYGRLLFAGFLGYVLFQEIPSAWAAAGSVVIIAAGVYTMHRNRIRQSEPAHPRAPVPPPDA